MGRVQDRGAEEEHREEQADPSASHHLA